MYFKIKSDIPHLSYILYKNPHGAPFTYNDKGLKFEGRFVNGSELEYEIIMERDDMHFLKTARKLNLDFYLNSEVSSVCPYNLRSLWETLKSCIQGKVPRGDITEEQFFTKSKNQEIIIGPIVNNFDFTQTLFNDYGITATQLNSGIETRSCFVLHLSPHDEITVTEFIQKVYVLSLFLGIPRRGIYKANDDFIDKIVSLSKTWLKGELDV